MVIGPNCYLELFNFVGSLTVYQRYIAQMLIS
jgi:hypothetical protein